MQLTRLFSGPDGCSHLEDVTLGLEATLEIEHQLSHNVSDSILFNETIAGHQYELHNAPRRQFIVTLQGEIEVETGDVRRRFGPGSVLIAEDLAGTGHRTKVTSSTPWRCLYIPY